MSAPPLLEIQDLSKHFYRLSALTRVSMSVEPGELLGLIGPNGSGKTTLLRLLVGELDPDEGTIRHGTRLEIAYFDQQREQLDPERSVADTINNGNDTVVVNGQPKHVLGYLAEFLFPKERAQSPVKSLSGGERNRLLLARLFARPANVLVLDEPTNDLDIETLELLEELVTNFPGTVLLVSHDRVFLDRVVTSTLAFEGDGRVTEYVGGYEDYLRQKDSTGDRGSKVEDRASKPDRNDRPASPKPQRSEGGRKLSYKEKQELDGLPERIAALEDEQRRLQADVGSPEFYKSPKDQITAVVARVDAVQVELDAALERWVELDALRT